MIKSYPALETLLNQSVFHLYYDTYTLNMPTDQVLQHILKHLERIGNSIYNKRIIIRDLYGNEGFYNNAITFIYLEAAVIYNLQEILIVLPEAIFRYNGNQTWSVCSEFSGEFLQKLGAI